MAKRLKGKERGDRITQVLQAGMQRIKESASYKEYLKMASKFYTYSWGNQLLIWIQNPKATRVATYKQWLQNFSRQVKGNERGIILTRPLEWTRKAKNEDEEDVHGLSFGTFAVFDIEQTEGDPLPELKWDDLEGDNDGGLYGKLCKVAKDESVKISTRKNGDDRESVKGWYSQKKGEIWIRPTLSPAMKAKTFAHELGHHFAQHAMNGDCSAERETVAESVSYIVCSHFGLDTSDYSFGYLASWSDTDIFKAKLAEINKAAKTIISKIGAEK